jgi:hypothetical protein
MGYPPRNDLKGAVALAKSISDDLGYLPARVYHRLWMLQDDPSELVEALRGMTVRPDPDSI